MRLILPTRRGLLRAVALAAPAIIIPKAVAQFGGCLPAFCGASVACGGFTPPPSGLIGWWDTSVTASLTVAGGLCSAIADQSGAGNNVTSTGSDLAYSATGFNTTFPAIVFDIAVRNGHFICDPFPMGTGSTLTAWYVGNLIDNSSAFLSEGRPLSYSAPGQNDFNNANSWAISRVNSNTLIQITRNNLHAEGVIDLTLPHRTIATIDSFGVETVYTNGVSVVGQTSPGNWITGGTMQLGRNPGVLLGFWNGPIAEWGVSTNHIDACQAAVFDTYLKNKWGM